MKLYTILILAFISLGLVSSQTYGQPGTQNFRLGKENTGGGHLWIVLGTERLKTDPDLQNLLNFGLQNVFTKGFQNGRLDRGKNYFFKNANYINIYQGISNVIFFDVNVQSTQEPVTIRVLIEINYTPGTDEKEVAFSAFLQTLYTGGTDEDFSTMYWKRTYSREEFNNDEHLQDILTFSVEEVLARGVERRAISSKKYLSAELYAIGADTIDDVNYYQISVGLILEDDRFIKANYMVREIPETGRREVVSYSVYMVLDEPASEHVESPQRKSYDEL